VKRKAEWGWVSGRGRGWWRSGEREGELGKTMEMT
jgi:hypothetical protein